MEKNKDNLDSADSHASDSGSLSDQDDPPTSEQVVKPSNSPIRVLCDFTDIISIRVKDKCFNVPRDLLSATSTFFDKQLGHSDPKKFVLVLDDIDASLFNTFINVLMESCLSKTFRIRNHNDPSTVPCQLLLQLWKVSYRFKSRRMCLLAEEALKTQYFTQFTPEEWESYYVENGEGCARIQIMLLEGGYIECKNEQIPFDGEFVIACANCPAQVVANHFDALGPSFKAKVVKRFATRMADPTVTQRMLAQRKRHYEDESEPEVSKKRRS